MKPDCPQLRRRIRSRRRIRARHDRNSNRLTQTNALHIALDEAYTYDNLNRLTATTRNGSAYQSWDLDALGNSDSVTTDGVQENRTHNDQNQLTEMGSSTLAFDDNGNETTDQGGKTFIYDAWNRQIEVKNGSTSLVRYAFDALNRRITEGTSEEYYSNQWQQIEERDSSGNTVVQSVWSPVFVDAMVERDRDTNSDGVTDERLYVAQDANFNVTALVSTGGTTLQRFQYDPYGKRTVLNGSWSGTTDVYVFLQGHQGGKIDPISGKMYFRNRIYDVDQMRWMQEDPAGHVDGMSLYQVEDSGPTGTLDPTGLFGGNPTEPYTLTTELYGAYLLWNMGRGRSPNNPVVLGDNYGELKSAISSSIDQWYKQFAKSHGPGYYEIDENAAAPGTWYTGKSDYSGLGLLAHSGNVHVSGGAEVKIKHTSIGCQKIVKFSAYWDWNDQVHGMTKQEWERRYPGQSGLRSPEVWLHWIADWYGAYYVKISWVDYPTYKGDTYGGEGAYSRALNSDARQD